MHDAMLERGCPGGGSSQFSRCQELGIPHSTAQKARHVDLLVSNHLCQTRKENWVVSRCPERNEAQCNVPLIENQDVGYD